jgi:hypothetical protein
MCGCNASLKLSKVVLKPEREGWCYLAKLQKQQQPYCVISSAFGLRSDVQRIRKGDLDAWINLGSVPPLLEPHDMLVEVLNTEVSLIDLRAGMGERKG